MCAKSLCFSYLTASLGTSIKLVRIYRTAHNKIGVTPKDHTYSDIWDVQLLILVDKVGN